MMKKLFAILLIIALLFTTAPLSFAQGGSSPAPVSTDYVANEIIITQKTDVTVAEPLPLVAVEVLDAGELTGENQRILKGTVPFGTDLVKFCQSLREREDILFADPNYIQTADSITIPAEAVKTGDDYNAFNWYRDSLALTEAWQSADTLGSSDVVVAVIDTGINTTHKEFEGALWSDGNDHFGYNACDDNYDVTDFEGHGSNVAGIIAMRANNFGLVGIAPRVKIMALKAAESTGFKEDDVITCLNYALEHGADIINMSFGSANVSATMIAAYQRASTKALMVAAAGNSSTDAVDSPQFPAACNGVLGVMSYGSYSNADRTAYTIDNGYLSSFSNFDTSGRYYQIAAPGVMIGGPSATSDTTFTYKTGTSQASPIVAGAAALYLSKHPDADPYQIKQALVDSADALIGGYYDDGVYKKLDISAALAGTPCQNPTVTLSDDALSLLSDCLETPLTSAKQSDLESLCYVSADKLLNYTDRLSVLEELSTVQYLDLSNLDLSDSQLSWLETAAFPDLHRLDVSENSALTTLRFGVNTAPHLRELFADNCALCDTESFENLSNLQTLSLSGNRFRRSAALEKLYFIQELDISSCALQECSAFRSFNNLDYLDVSDNYITDISPIAFYSGYYLNISLNPLGLGVRQDYYVDCIEESMKDNPYAYRSGTFSHNKISGADGKTYSLTESAYLPSLSVARTAQVARFAPVLTPADATVHSAALFQSNDIAIDSLSGIVRWQAADISESTTALIHASLPAFAQMSASLHILAPEVTEFTFDNGSFTLVANAATETVTIGEHTLRDYVEEGDARSFTVPADIVYAPTMTATACDSLGAGKSLTISKKTQTYSHPAKILAFSADKEAYTVGEEAVIFVKCNSFTNYVKLKDCLYHTELVSDRFEEVEDGRVFRFTQSLTASRTHKYKAYASQSTDFAIGAKVLRFTVAPRAESLHISAESGSSLYFAPNQDSFVLEPQIFPQKAAASTAVSYSISDENVAQVAEDGTVTALDYGEAILTASTDNGLRAQFPLIVSPPKINDPDVTAGYYNEESYIEFYTKGATDLHLCYGDGSPLDFAFAYESDVSDIDGYDTYWIVALYTTSSEPFNLRVYATDEKGLNENTPYRLVNITPIVPVQDFSFEADTFSFDRAAGAVKISLQVYPENANDFFSWSISGNTVAGLQGYSNYAILTPKKSGTVTLTASISDGVEENYKSVKVTFTEGKIREATLSDDSPLCYEPIEVRVITDTSVSYIHLEDEDNLLAEEYAAYCFFEDKDGLREWTLPFIFKEESTCLRVWGGDAVGNLSEAKYLDVQATMPESAIAPNAAVITGQVGQIVDLHLISLPDKHSVSLSEYTVSADGSDVADFALGTVTLLQEGVGTLTCHYAGRDYPVRVITYNPVTAITLPIETLSLGVGEGYVLEPQVSPVSAEKLFFTSSDSSVAEVDENGVIHAVSLGTATVTVKSKGGVSASLAVIVKSDEVVTELDFDQEHYNLLPGETLSYSLISNLSSLANKVSFYTSNKKVLTVDSDGHFLAKKEGDVTITAVADSGMTATATVGVHCDKAIILNRESVETTPKTSFTVSAMTLPQDLDVDGFFFSDNMKVAVVSQTGVVSTKCPGTCTIYFLSEDGQIATCLVHVHEQQLTKVKLAKTQIEIAVNQNHIIAYTKISDKASEVPRFVTSDARIAAVDDNGIIYGVSEGTAIVTLVLQNGLSYPMTVTVTDDKLTLSGSINCAATLQSTNLFEQVQENAVSGAFALADLPQGSYSFVLSAPHHTSITISDATLFNDADLGALQLHNGDANGDGVVDIADISLLLSEAHYGKAAAEVGATLDINDDGEINVLDINETALAENFGGCDQDLIY